MKICGVSDRGWRSTALFILLSVLFLGCRNAPFYRMTSKASQSLPLRREGIVAYERGDLSLAEEKFAEALRLNESDVETNRYYGETLWKLGKREEALETLRNAVGKHGALDAETSLYISIGEKALELGDPNEALVYAERVVSQSPKDVAGWELHGRANRALGNTKEALLDLQRAWHFSLDDREILLEIAELQLELEDYDSSLATLQCLERLYPTNHEPAEVLAAKGRAYVGLGFYSEAETAYAIAVRYEPKSIDYRAKLAETTMLKGNYAETIAVLDDVQEGMADDPTLQSIRQRATERLEELARIQTENGILR